MWFGGRFFPGTNLQDLNLDWIIQKVKDVSDTVAGVDERIAGAYEAAEQAQESASAAETSAQQAQSSASAAETSAQAAQTTAQAAQTTAQAAQTTAQAAQTETTRINTYLSDHIPVDGVADLGTNGETSGTSTYPEPYGIVRVVRFTASTLSHPGPASSGGFCLTFALNASNGVQIALVMGQRTIYVRSRNSGTWLDWAVYAPPTAGTTGLTPVSGTLDTGALNDPAELTVEQPQESAE